VLAEGEQLEEVAHFKKLEEEEKIERSANIVQVEASLPDEMMCIAESSFIAVIVTVSLLCVLFSGIIVTWACQRAKSAARKTSQLSPVMGAI